MNEDRTRTIGITAPATSAARATAAHEIVCASRSALAAVYDEISEVAGVETCAVDLPNLRLVVRIADSGLSMSAIDPTLRWIERVQRIASGL